MFKEKICTFTDKMPMEDMDLVLLGVKNIMEVFRHPGGYSKGLYTDEKRTYPFRYLDQGNYGITFEWKDYVIKYIYNHMNDGMEIVDEVTVYKDLQSIEAIPSLYGYNDELLIIEKIKGKNVYEVATPENWHELQKKIYEINKMLIKKGYYPYDLEYYVTPEGNIRLFDFNMVEKIEDGNVAMLEDLTSRMNEWKQILDEITEDIYIRMAFASGINY